MFKTNDQLHTIKLNLMLPHEFKRNSFAFEGRCGLQEPVRRGTLGALFCYLGDLNKVTTETCPSAHRMAAHTGAQ